MISSWNPFVTRFGIGSCAETSLLLQIFKIGVMEIKTDQLTISQTSVYKRNTAAVEIHGQEYGNELVDKCSKLKLVVHFDSKIMEQYLIDTKFVSKTDKLAI